MGLGHNELNHLKLKKVTRRGPNDRNRLKLKEG